MAPLQHLLVVGAAVSTVLAAPAIPNAEPACEPLSHGRGLIPRPDTAEAFQSFPVFSLAATSATTPVGYVQAYSNLVTTFNEPSQFLHYFDLDSYDVNKCAAACGEDDKCNIFGIFFERTPLYKPGPKCPNPSSSTMIKCTLWSGTISPKAKINNGQTREQFRIVMAGSNAYVKDITFSNKKDGSSNILKNWVVEKYQNDGAIQVPLDCNGVDTYMGMAAWRDGKFDAQRCLDACKVAGNTDIQSRKCRFVNTYVQRRNGIQIAQHCAMFSEYWPAPFATNLGQRRGDAEISQTDSYGLRRVEVKGTACYKPQDPLVPVPPQPSTISDASVTSAPTPMSAGPSPSKPAAPLVIASSSKPAIPTPVGSSPIPSKSQISATGAQSQVVTSSLSPLSTSIAVPTKAPTPNISAPTSTASVATAKVSGTPSAVPSTPLSTPAASSKAQITSSGSTATLSKVSVTPPTALGTSSVLPATSSVVPSTASVGPATVSLVSSAVSVVPGTSSTVLGNSSVALASSAAALSTPSVAPSSVPATPSVLPATPLVLPSAPSVTPGSAVVPEASSAASSASSQLPASPSVTPSTASVLSATPSNALSTPAAAPAISSAAPSVVPATPSSPLNTSSTALITPSKPSAGSSTAQSIPSVLSATPSSTPSASLLSSATPATPSPPPPTSQINAAGIFRILPKSMPPIEPVNILPVIPTSMPPLEPRPSALPDSPDTLSVRSAAESTPTASTLEPILYATAVSPPPSSLSPSPSSSASPSSPHPTFPAHARVLARGFYPFTYLSETKPHTYHGGMTCWPSRGECWWEMNKEDILTDPNVTEEKFDPKVDERKWNK